MPRQLANSLKLKIEEIIIMLRPSFQRDDYFIASFFFRSEYRNNFQATKGDRVTPAWITNFEKVTIDGDASRQ